MIDLRSDTVTKPTDEMRKAMASAEVGDDVYGEDPTVRKLEEMAADLVGKEDALFVVSGTMGNLVSLLSHTCRGESVLLGKDSHIFNYEVGGISVVAGLLPITFDDSYGFPNKEEVVSKAKRENIHFAHTSLCCFEVTHNRAGGVAPSADVVKEVMSFAKENGLKVHLDGARVFNASVVWEVDAKEYCKFADSVMFCLSKGLSAPIGSLICGCKEFIKRARHKRKLVGGGLRQVGVVAACGIVALSTMIDRLAEDHENANLLAQKLKDVPNISVEDIPEGFKRTNMVYFKVPKGKAYLFQQECEKEGLLFNAVSDSRIRLVTHKDVNKEAILRAVDIIYTIANKIF